LSNPSDVIIFAREDGRNGRRIGLGRDGNEEKSPIFFFAKSTVRKQREQRYADEGDDHLARRWACHAARHLLNIYKHTTVNKS
jgi:hypothetical protein